MYNKNAWSKYEGKALDELMQFNEGYKKFISYGKTERLCVKEAIEIANLYGVDVNSGCKNNLGKKDAIKVKEFVKNAKKEI